MQLLTQTERERRLKAREAREASRLSRTRAVEIAEGAEDSRTVWRTAQLPTPRTASAGVPLSEGVTSVFLGAIAYVPVALFTDYAAWNFVVAAVLTFALSYALFSRRVVVGPGFVAVRKLGPYRIASAESVTAGALTHSQRGGVLKLRTGDGHTMRLRRVEYSKPAVNAALRAFILGTGRKYDEGVMQLLSLPWREEFGHHRYLLDAVQ